MSDTSAGAVAAGHELTARAAADVLANGGNAFDAAIAGLWMGLPCRAGAGLAWRRRVPDGARRHERAHHALRLLRPDAAQKRDPRELEFFEVHADFGTATQQFHIGHGASATPGFVPGLYAVHDDLGSMPMDRLLEPAMSAARDGVVTTRFQAFLAQVVKPILTATETGRAQFAPHGGLRGAGDTFHNRGLADFYEGLAAEGLDFYLGAAAERFAAAQSESGQLRMQDFADYRVERRTPLEIELAGARVSVNPPPSAGGAFIAHALHGLERMEDGAAATVARALGASTRRGCAAGATLSGCWRRSGLPRMVSPTAGRRAGARPISA